MGAGDSGLHRAVRRRRIGPATAGIGGDAFPGARFTGRPAVRRSSWAHKGEVVGRLHRVSDQPRDVIPDADVVFVAAPANAHPPILRAIAPHTRDGQLVGALYAQGGFDWAARAALGPRVGAVRAVFGLQNIPWICKAPVYGKEARCVRRGLTSHSHLASTPAALRLAESSGPRTASSSPPARRSAHARWRTPCTASSTFRAARCPTFCVLP